MKVGKHVHRPEFGEVTRCRICGRVIYRVPADDYRAEHWRAAPRQRL